MHGPLAVRICAPAPRSSSSKGLHLGRLIAVAAGAAGGVCDVPRAAVRDLGLAAEVVARRDDDRRRGDTTVVVWDADTGALLYAEEPDPARRGIADVIFSRFGAARRHVERRKGPHHLHPHVGGRRHHANNGSSVGLVGFTPDGSKLLAANQLMANTGGSLHWYDLAADQLALSKNDIHEGSLRSVALSPDGALVATAASDGLVRVWDGATLELVHEVPLGDSQIQGVAFVDDDHLAVTPRRATCCSSPSTPTSCSTSSAAH